MFLRLKSAERNRPRCCYKTAAILPQRDTLWEETPQWKPIGGVSTSPLHNSDVRKRFAISYFVSIDTLFEVKWNIRIFLNALLAKTSSSCCCRVTLYKGCCCVQVLHGRLRKFQTRVLTTGITINFRVTVVN